jgi:hypothetical protein
MMPPIRASISRKSFNKVSIIIFQMLLAAGRRSHNDNNNSLWVRGGFYGFDYGKSKYYGFGLGSNISEGQ